MPGQNRRQRRLRDDVSQAQTVLEIVGAGSADQQHALVGERSVAPVRYGCDWLAAAGMRTRLSKQAAASANVAETPKATSGPYAV